MQMQVSSATGDWIMSRVAGEGAPAYAYTGTQFNVFDTQPAGVATLPLYRCIDSFGTHYQATTANCDGVAGASHDGPILGYIYAAQGAGSEPIYRCISPTGRPIVMTPRLSDCSASGWIVQGLFGYAFDPSVHAAP